MCLTPPPSGFQDVAWAPGSDPLVPPVLEVAALNANTVKVCEAFHHDAHRVYDTADGLTSQGHASAFGSCECIAAGRAGRSYDTQK